MSKHKGGQVNEPHFEQEGTERLSTEGQLYIAPMATNYVSAQWNGEQWLIVTQDGVIEHFDVTAMNKAAEDGCPYARAFKAVYGLGIEVGADIS